MVTVLTATIYILFIILFVGMIGYVFFTRRTKNLLTQILKRKSYVVCHLRRANTTFEDVYNVVPESDYLTKVEKFSYDLNPKYAVMLWKKRLHYVLSENNVIPLHFEKDNNDEILFQAMEVQNALNNNVTEYLFTKKKEILILGLFLISIIAVISIIYTITQLTSLIEKMDLVLGAVNP